MLIHTPIESNFISWITGLMYNFLCLYSYRLLSFPKLHRLAFFLPTSSVRKYHRLLIQLDHFITLCIPFWDPLTSKLIFLKFAYIKDYFFCKILWIFTINIVIYQPLLYHTKYFHHSKISTMLHLFNFPFPQLPDNHWSFYYFYKFAFPIFHTIIQYVDLSDWLLLICI